MLSDEELSHWQQKVDDNTKLTKLSIVGTHNSFAHNDISLPSVQCQDASVTDQLNHGVRFLDIRCGRKPLSNVINTITTTIMGGEKDSSADVKELYIVHGNFPVKLPTTTSLEDGLKEVYDFLDKHPSECVIVSIKQEGEGAWTGDDFANLVWKKYVEPRKDKYYLKNEIPRMRDCRGKILLFRRFAAGDGNLASNLGFNADNWAYNTTEDDRGSYSVQDFCEIQQASDIEKKAGYIKTFSQKASDYIKDHDDKLFVNFCSGSNFFDTNCWPSKVAEGLNKCNIGECFEKGCGIIVMDFVKNDNWKNVRELTSKNF